MVTGEDHPRMRGEDRGNLGVTIAQEGSPPHARGRPSLQGALARRDGITPACAGKTFLPYVYYLSRSDHPRMRGEDNHAARISTQQAGSPPHARGRRTTEQAAEWRASITPACAGKTDVLPQIRRTGGDHPRMRGEDATPVEGEGRLAGSPPHARGRQKRRHRPVRDPGITPACAGKTPHD